MFQGQTASIPGRMKQPMGMKDIDRQGTKHTTLSRSSTAYKDNQKKNRRRQFP